MDIHPQLRALLDELAEAGYPDQTTVPIAEAREITDTRAARHYGDKAAVAEIREITIPGPAGPLAARVYRPEGGPEPLPVLVYFHGGGWVLGSLDSHDRGVRALTNAAGCLSISVAYRLAPEHPFPAPVDDCWAALNWVADNAATLGGDPARLAVGGDSAGGNLSAVCALLAAQAGAPKLGAQILIYPVVDSDLDNPSYKKFADAPMLPGRRMAYFWDQYVPNQEQRTDWRAAPLRAPDLSGLPPTLIVGAGIDPLVSEGKAYAERLEQAGVPVTYKLFPGMTHAFFQGPGRLADARAAADAAGQLLRNVFAGKYKGS